MNTENGISADEACRMHALTQEDFTRMCNDDGSLKSQQKTTTFSLKDDPSKTITIDNSALYVSAAVIVLLVVCAVILLIRRKSKKKA